MNKNIFFPKKSHHGYYDQTFQRHFYDKSQKRDFMNKHGFVEGDPATRAHKKRVRDFADYVNEERRKNPNFRMKEKYPN